MQSFNFNVKALQLPDSFLKHFSYKFFLSQLQHSNIFCLLSKYEYMLLVSSLYIIIYKSLKKYEFKKL